MAYTRIPERVFRVWNRTDEQFQGGLRIVPGDVVEVGGGLGDSGLVLEDGRESYVIGNLPRMLGAGSVLPVLGGGAVTLSGDYVVSFVDTDQAFFVGDVSGDRVGFVAAAQWVLEGIFDILRDRIDPPDKIQPYGSGGAGASGYWDFQPGDNWPPAPMPSCTLTWVDVMQQNGFQAWANAAWAFLSWSEYPEAQALVAWDLSGGFQIDPIASWIAIEGREPIVSAENTLDSLGITWRLVIQSGVKYLQAQVCTISPEQPSPGFFRPRNGFGHPGIAGLQAMCAGLYVLFGSRVKEDV
jgi:hypothetical protein